MVMGSLFDTPTDEEDQNPPQPQQPPPQDPLAQQPTQDQIDSLNHAQGVVQQGLQTVTNMFGPQAQQTADQNSINQAQNLVGGALQGVNTVAQAGAPPPPPVQGQDYIDAPTNSLRAQLEQNRQGQSQYGYAGQALATALPMVAFGAPAAAAGLGIQAATQAAGLPQPIQDVASLLPFTEGGLVQRGLQAGLGGLGAYGGQQADQALNLPQIPGLGGPGALLGGIGGFGAAGALERGVGGLARNADPLAGIQPVSPPAATGIASALDTPRNNWFSDLSATETPWEEASKAATPQYERNIGNLEGAQTGQPVDFTGFRQEGTGERRPGTGTFYGLDPATSSLYGLDRGQENVGGNLQHQQGGPESTLTVDHVQLQNPLVVEGGHHELGLTYQDVLAPSPARDALTEYWQHIPENPRESWYVKSDQLIADAAKASGYDGIVYRRPTEDMGDFANWGKQVPVRLQDVGNRAINDTEIVKFDQTPTTTTTAPTSTTTTSGAYPPRDQFVSDEHQQGYNQGLLDTTQLAPHEFRPTRGPDDTDFNQGYKEARANLPPGSLVNQPYMPPPEAPTGPAGFRPVGQGLIAEGTDGTIHNITGFLGARGDGEQFFQTEDGVVPLSQLTNLSAADRAELGQMRTAAGGMPPNTPNAAPPSGPNAPGAQGFQQSPAGQQFAGQGAAGMNVTQPGVSSSNAAPSTTYGGGAGGITGQAPPAGRPSSGGGAGQPPRGNVPTGKQGGVDWDPIHNAFSAIGAPTQTLLVGPHIARIAPLEITRPVALGNGLKAMGEALATGKWDNVYQHIQNDLGLNVKPGLRPEDYRAAAGNPRLNTTAVQWAINHTPIIGPILNRGREMNGALLGATRDAHYLIEADKVARTDPTAPKAVYDNLWREANNATMHTTIPGMRGNSVISGVGVGPNAVAAHIQELGNLVIGTGAPLPWAAGSRGAAFRSLMGPAFTMAASAALAKTLGANVNVTDPFNNYGLDSTFLKPITSNGIYKTAYGTGGAGFDTLLKGAANIGNDLAHGDFAAARDHALSFGRGEMGVLPSGVIDGILGKTWDNKPYSWDDFLHEAETAFLQDPKTGKWGEGRGAPIPLQENLKAIDAYGPEGILRALPADIASSVNTSAINTTSQAFKYATTPETLTRAFQGEDKPLATILQGKDWNDLMSTEKSALTKTLDPQVLQQIHDESYQRNPETTKHSDTVQYISDKKTATENATLDRYNRKEITADEAASQMKAAQKEYFAVKNQLDSMPGYLAEQKKFDKSNESDAQLVLDGFYQLQTKADRQAYIAAVIQHEPELGARLLLATQPRNQSKLEELYYSGQLK